MSRSTVGVVCLSGLSPARGGRVRNEDNYLLCVDGQARYLKGEKEHAEAADGLGVFLAVCDGMGGHSDGHIASQAACGSLLKLFVRGPTSEPETSLLKFVQTAHEQLHWKVREAGPVEMGTTLTAAWLLGNELVWVSVGDSRLYLLRDGTLQRVSRDHTRAEFRRRDGLSTSEEDHQSLAQTFIFGSRGLGNPARLRLEKGLDSGSMVALPGDRILLCSDGLWAAVPEQVLEEALGVDGEAADIAAKLGHLALEAESEDNITAVVCIVGSQLDFSHLLEVSWDDDDDDTYLF